MKTLRRGWRRALGALSGWRRESDLEDEFAAHLEMQIDDNLRAGMTPAEARRAARLKFGNVELMKEDYRGQRGLPFVEALFQDLRYALRALRKSPAFTVVTVLALGLGIGAVTAVFSLVDQVLLRPPGIRNPERVVAVETRYGKLNLQFPITSGTILADLHGGAQVFEHAALMSPRDLNYTGAGDPQRLQAAVVTGEWFDTFGARPYLGRTFRNEEDQPHTNRVTVLSYAAWLRLFGGDPSALGRTIELDQVPHRIVGVMPPDFRWPQRVDLWTPAGLPADALAPEARFGTEHFLAVARTRPEVPFRTAKEWMRLFSDRIQNGGGRASVIAKDYAWSVSATPFTEMVAGETRTPLLVLSGAVGFVMLIVCFNVAGLLLARATSRSGELGVRAALGVTRGQLLRAALVESLLLALLGGVSGLALADEGIRLLLRLAPETVAAGLDPRMDPHVLLFCALAALVSAVLFGVAPAWQISRPGPNSALKSADRSSSGGRGSQRMRSILVISETALALMLLVAAGLFLRSFVRLQGVRPGFEPRGVMTAAFWLPQAAYPSERQETVFYRSVLDRLNQTPGVTVAALGSPIPFLGVNADVFQIEGRTPAAGELLPYAEIGVVTPGYFRALEIPLKRGRYFSDTDSLTSERVAVIDENLARQYWPGEDPVGKRIGRTSWYRVVGVVGHVTNSSLAADSGKGMYYVSMLQRPTAAATILVKTQGDVNAAQAAIREAVRYADPRQSVHSIRGLESLVSESLAPRRFGMRLLGFFGAIALFLAALGLYGVVSYSVTRRRREIGIRLALGAEQHEVMALVVGQGMRLVGIGAVIGIIGSLAGARWMQSQLFEVSPFDPLTILGMGAVLLLAAMLASYLPARRAMRVDPVIALRPE